MTNSNRIAELEALWRKLAEEVLALQKQNARAEAGRQVLLRALTEARDALEVGRVREALLILREVLDERRTQPLSAARQGQVSGLR